ncbi:MAG: hypothetical protein JWR35_834 [Marmoricola sp.]|jgi:hypothetical protein|nr:hypothetical protein [Marmoricola sp.]
MTATLRKGLVLLVIVFAGYYIFNDPSGAASFSKQASSHIWDGLVQLFQSLIDFLNALFS